MGMAELGEEGMPPQEDLHQDAEEVGMTVLQEGAHHQEEILETEMVEDLGDQAPGMILHVTAEVQGEVEGILVTNEVLHQDVGVIGHPLGEDLLLGVDLPQGEVHPQGVALPLAEDQDPVTMDLPIGAVTDLLLVTIHPLLNRPDQPVIIKTMAGQLSSVRPKVSWEYPGSQDICQTTRVYHASSFLLALVT